MPPIWNAGRGGLERQGPPAYVLSMANDLIAVNVHTDDVGDYNVTEPGWYAVDDGGKVVLGPFVSLAECERAIHDRLQRIIPKVPD